MQLKLYTRKEAQSGEISYKDEEKGYMCDVYSFSWEIMIIPVIITTAAICISCKVLYYLLNAKSERADVNRAVFFSLGFVAFLVNAADVIILIYEISTYIRDMIIIKNIDYEVRKLFISDVAMVSHGIVKVLELVVGILVFVIGGAIITLRPSKYLQRPQLCNPKSCSRCCSFASKCAYFLYFVVDS